MPLIKSGSESAFDTNVSEMINAGHPRDQALAAAYRVKRQSRAPGGQIKPPSASWITRNEARGMMHAGPIMSSVAGRTDHHPMNVKSGSYVLPADHVSSMGQGNTINGVAQLNHMFKMGPYGSPAGTIRHGAGAPKPPAAPRLRADGGSANEADGEPVPINAAGGEFVVPPEKILEWMERSGFHPDLDDGHKALDAWVVEHRKKHRKTLAKLPGPAKS
jgi:hypothetical protein